MISVYFNAELLPQQQGKKMQTLSCMKGFAAAETLKFSCSQYNFCPALVLDMILQSFPEAQTSPSEME